jgi:sulfite oxidase
LENPNVLNRRQLLKQSGLVAPFLLSGSVALSAQESAMIVHGRVPHNSETRLDRLIESWITPNELFYVRSHAPVPKVDVDRFRLTIDGLVKKPLTISLAELNTGFSQRSVVATLTCAGNRRAEHSAVRKVGGVQWQAGAIGNAKWSGVTLADLLKRAGLKEGAKHVRFEGMDQIERSNGVIPFGASIPLEKAISDPGAMPGALIATGMNGQPLPPDHGFPIRTIVPGFIGARSVKWLGKIVVSDRPSPNHYVATAYRLVKESTPENWAAASILYDVPLNSVTCLPAQGASLKGGVVSVSGFALAPATGGRTVRRVEISVDRGKTWSDATFTTPAVPFCWRLWTAKIALRRGTTELVVRATDSAGNVQAKSVPWNLKGYMFNAWHHTRVDVS